MSAVQDFERRHLRLRAVRVRDHVYQRFTANDDHVSEQDIG
jgi:hypothetical protein